MQKLTFEQQAAKRRRKRIGAFIKLLALAFLFPLSNWIFPWLSYVSTEPTYHLHMWLSYAQPSLGLDDSDSTPIVIRNSVIDPNTGHVLRPANWGIRGARNPRPVEGEPGHYFELFPREEEWGRYNPLRRIVDIGTGERVRDEYSEIRPPGYRETTLIRQRVDGSEIWRTDLKASSSSVRPPSWLVTQGYVVVVYDEEDANGIHGLAALDRSNGSIVWKQSGPSDRLFCTEALVLAVNCGSSTKEPVENWLVGRKLGDGAEVLRVRVPDNSDSRSINKFGDLFCVTGDHPDDFLVLFDVKGNIVYQSAEEVLAGVGIGADVLLLTSKRLVRIGRNGKVVWENARFKEVTRSVASGHLQVLPDGDVLLLAYGAISDDIERVARVSPANGEVVWSSRCGGIGLYGHSAYWHEAYLEIRGDFLFVIGQAMHGDTITVLSLESGIRRRCWIYNYD